MNEKSTSSKGRNAHLPAAVAAGLARHQAHEQLIYKHKLSKLKRMIKELVLENASLCDQVASVQEEVAISCEERRHLLRKLLQCQSTAEHNSQLQNQPKNYQSLSLPTNSSIADFATDTNSNSTKIVKLSQPKKKTGSDKIRNKSNSKIKRLSPPITLDSTGRPIFPILFGPLTVHSLGEIVTDRELYHTEKAIYPVGFYSTRSYASLTDPCQAGVYTCTIQDSGNAPRFEIQCEEDEDLMFSGASPVECHIQVLRRLNLALGMELLPASVDSTGAEERGLRFFGVTHPSIQNVIQACPGAKKCTKYKWNKFEVCKSESDMQLVANEEREASICHETLLRNIRFACQLANA